MNDEETVALIAGGHTFGKTHGAGDPTATSVPTPRRAPLEDAGPGLAQRVRHRHGRRHDHQRAGGHLDLPPDPLGQRVLPHPVLLRVGAVQEPGRREPVAAQERRRRRSGPAGPRPVGKREPRMLTSDLALRVDPAYEKISRRFYENPDEFADAFARAWFKLTHRDMGPLVALPRSRGAVGGAALAGPAAGGRPRADRRSRRGGAEGADPGVRAEHLPAGVDRPGRRPRPSAAATSAAASTAPASGWPRRRTGRSTTRSSWPPCWRRWRASRAGSTRRRPAQAVSLADLIVLAGNAAVEQAAKDAGVDVVVPFHPGRVDASRGADRRRVVRLPGAGRRRLPQLLRQVRDQLPAEYLLVDKANLLTLSAPEMTVLVGGLRVLGPTGTARRPVCSPIGRAC